MEPLSPRAVARADTEATPADCLPGPVLPLRRAPLRADQSPGEAAADAIPTTAPSRLRPARSWCITGGRGAGFKMTVHLDPPDLIVHALRQAQHLGHAAVDGIGKLIGTAGDRAPSEVGRKHARRMSCLWLPDPTGTDCLGAPCRGTGREPAWCGDRPPHPVGVQDAKAWLQAGGMVCPRADGTPRPRPEKQRCQRVELPRRRSG